MLSETLAKGLSGYAIGDKLRALRLKKSMGLVELGSHTGMSAAMLSKIERGKLFPTLPTLLRIALVFSVGLEYFFSDDQKGQVLAIVRRPQRKRFPGRADGSGVRLPLAPLSNSDPFQFETLSHPTFRQECKQTHFAHECSAAAAAADNR